MKMRIIFGALLCLCLSACGGLPKGIDPVGSFEVDRYLGTWYELARLDHRFERGLSNVSAEYTMKANGEIRVINRGYNEEDEAFSEAVGRAKFARNLDEGFLKVSFFGPFYGSYVVFELDENYQRAYVAGDDRSYLWFLSRTPTVSEAQMDAFLEKTEALGFPVEELIFVDQALAKNGDL